MGTWKTYKLGDVAKFHDNKRIPLSSLQRQEHQGAYPYYGAACILDYVDGYLFDGDFILVGEDGTVITPEGKAVVQWVTGKFWVNNHAHVITARKDFSQRFLYYLLSEFRIGPYVTGAAQPKVSKGRLEVVKISLPPLEEQERIAGVLGAYDDLIAVNERRMALLEEAAHRLWRDRFVTHVDPTWDRKPLGEMAEFIHNTYRPSENWPFITYLDTGNITRNRIDTLVTAPFRDLPTSAKRKVSPGDFIYSTVRPNKLHYGLFLQVPEHFLVSTAFAVIRGKIAISSSIYLYHLLIDEQMTDYLHAIGEQTSATYPTINEDDMAPMTVLCPPLEIQEEFTRYVLPYHEAFDTLARENALLREGRDRLLPRLLREEA